MVTINGELAEAQGMTLLAYLEQAGYDWKRIAVERNLEIVPKSAFGDTVIQDGDTLEIVSFVGGG